MVAGRYRWVDEGARAYLRFQAFGVSSLGALGVQDKTAGEVVLQNGVCRSAVSGL